MPWLCNSLIKFSSASQALVSMKFTESASSSTCFAGGRFAASAAFNASSRRPMLAKNRSPPTRQISSPGKVSASDVAIGLLPRQLAQRRALRMARSIDQHQQGQSHAEGDALQDAQRQLSGNDDRSNSKLLTVAGEQVAQIARFG